VCGSLTRVWLVKRVPHGISTGCSPCAMQTRAHVPRYPHNAHGPMRTAPHRRVLDLRLPTSARVARHQHHPGALYATSAWGYLPRLRFGIVRLVATTCVCNHHPCCIEHKRLVRWSAADVLFVPLQQDTDTQECKDTMGSNSPQVLLDLSGTLAVITCSDMLCGLNARPASIAAGLQDKLSRVSLACNATPSPTSAMAHEAGTADVFNSQDVEAKTQICFDFTKGMCTRGDKCKYSHDIATIVHFNSKEKGICFDYLRNQCHRGLLCRFSHDLSNIAQQCQVWFTWTACSYQPGPDSLGLHAQVYNGAGTRNRTNAICYDFVKGVCQRGTECRYSHDLTLIARTARSNAAARSTEVCYDYLRCADHCAQLQAAADVSSACATGVAAPAGLRASTRTASRSWALRGFWGQRCRPRTCRPWPARPWPWLQA
jgi:hypothetical protein